MCNGERNCCVLRSGSKTSSSMKLFLSMVPLILVAVVGIVSILSPKERGEIVDLRSQAVQFEMNSSHIAFNHSSSTPFPVHPIHTLQQSVSTLFPHYFCDWFSTSFYSLY